MTRKEFEFFTYLNTTSCSILNPLGLCLSFCKDHWSSWAGICFVKDNDDYAVVYYR